MLPNQTGILKEIPSQARYLTFSLKDKKRIMANLQAVLDLVDGDNTIMGIGRSLVMALDKDIPGLDVFPHHAGAGVDVPSTPAALWFWLRGDDRGELIHRTRRIEHCLAPAFRMDTPVDAFRYKTGHDLTGYEDGTENPVGDAAVDAGIVQGSGAGLDGSSFVAVQVWRHDLDTFSAMSDDEQDNTFGRHKSNNEEFDEAPESAHVKRTAQESYDPEAFIVRRSMPWANERQAGLVFVAFGRSFTAFATILNRMVGNEDGIPDALFGFTRPLSGAYFWCPPMQQGRPDLSRLGF